MPDQQQPVAPPAVAKRRDIITPYAFQVHPALLGLPLAQPWRRAVAIAVDGVLVGVLSQVPNAFLVLATSVVMWRWTGKTRHPRALRWRGSLRVMAVTVFLVSATVLWTGSRVELDGSDPDAVDVGVEVDVAQVMEFARLAVDIGNSTCRELACAREPLLKYAELAGREEDVDDTDAWTSAMGLIEGLHLSDTETTGFREEFRQRFNASRSAHNATDIEPPPPGRARQAVHSVIAWGRGLLDDLGIGLGWAALYFTVFSAWWNGQTPGKKLLGIRVVQLDGTPISLWEAFERCGGYGAGLATGLLGFVQVWWDPNRQAIHDKIAETVVIRGRGPLSLE